ncbi:MAG: Wzz/FepE/Etk N-terminal domain-containing protein [Bacteroidales bacterium]
MNNQNSKPNTSSEIDLIEIIRHLWSGRKLILKITGAFFVLGLIIALTSPKQYSVETKLLPETKSNDLGGASALLSQFSGLGGFALPMGEGADAIGPMLYPDVLESTPFFLELLEYKVTLKTDNKSIDITVFEYLNEHFKGSLLGGVKKYTIGLPWTISNWIRGKGEINEEKLDLMHAQLTRMTKEQFETIEDIQDKISASIDQKNGVISVSAEFDDPFITAQIADFAVNYLSNYITEYRIEKAKDDLLFIEDLHEEKKKEYIHAQKELAVFKDANRNVQSAEAKTKEEHLKNKYTIAFNVYNGLAQQLEQARIKVQEETPVIKMLEPVSVPVKRSKPRRALILFLATFLGGFVGVGTLIVKHIVNSIRKNLQKQN